MMITATPDDSAVARARRDDTALWVATLRHTLAMKLLVWRAQIRRNHPLTLKSPLLSFLGGITVGVVIVWSFDLQSSMNGFIAETMPPSVLPVAANAVHFPRQDLLEHPTSLAVSAVPTTTPPSTITKLTTAGEERRPTMTRTVAVSNRPDVSRGVTAAVSSPTQDFVGRSPSIRWSQERRCSSMGSPSALRRSF